MILQHMEDLTDTALLKHYKDFIFQRRLHSEVTGDDRTILVGHLARQFAFLDVIKEAVALADEVITTDRPALSEKAEAFKEVFDNQIRNLGLFR